jgi:hypothetical protein
VLGREITHLTVQAASMQTSVELPKVEVWLGRDVEAEHVRATMRPDGMLAPPLPPRRASSHPEIVIDGLKLNS